MNADLFLSLQSRLFEQIERLQGQLLIVQAHSEAIDNMTRVIHDNARTIHQNAQAIQQNADFDPASIPGSIADRTSTTSTYLPGAGQATRPATVQQGHDSAQPVVQRMNVQQSPLLFNTSALSTNGERGFTPSIQLDQRGDSQSVDEVGGVARYNPRAPRDLPRPLHRAQGNRPIFRQVLGTIHDPRVGRVTEDNIGEAYFRLRNHADSLQSRVDVSDAENMRLRSTIESLGMFEITIVPSFGTICAVIILLANLELTARSRTLPTRSLSPYSHQ